MLPHRAADVVARATGWRHNHGRVRLVSPGQLGRLLRAGGFQPLGVRAFGGGSDWRGRVGESLGTFYALGAQKLTAGGR